MFAKIGPAVSMCFLSVAAVCLLGTPALQAQDEEQKGVDQGNYNVKQSIEFGGRFVSMGGNTQVYDTFVNLRQGPRLLGFTTEMNSLNHHGTWFDRLYFNNSGYGGDPNSVSWLRVNKNRWYNFNALFRKDENAWDYPLQANPLNPTAPFANGPAGFGAPACTSCALGFSPHLFNTRRKLGDYNFIVLPDSKVRFRAGYSRNVVQGPVLSSIHQGTEQALLEDYKTTVNTYRFGIDIKVLPRTNISYDQLWNYYKGDTGSIDAVQSPALSSILQQFQVTPTQVVDLGFSFNATAGQPCSVNKANPTGTFLPSGFVSPLCSAYFNYFNHGRTRTNTPTEQLNVQSNYWQNLDLTARVSYSSGDADVFGHNETLFGRESRTNLRNQTTTGPVFGRRVSAGADLGATWYITKKFSFSDTFHFFTFHNPMEFASSTCSFFSPRLTTPANIFTPAFPVPLTCLPPTPNNGGAASPVHTTSAGPDISVLAVGQFLKQDEKNNVAEFEYRFSSHLGARLGYRYRSRTIADASFATGTFIFFPDNQNNRTPPAPYNNVTCPVANNVGPVGNALDPCVLPFASTPDTSETPIHEHAGLFGLWWRPSSNFRISYDMELMSADKSFTRISPRQSQEYRIRAKYQPANWLNLSGSARIWEGRDNVTDINNLQHDRVYGFSAIFQPNDKLGFELGYDYNDVFSQIIICYVATPAPPITTTCGTPFLQQLSTYTSKSHYGYLDASWTPVKRFTARLGANLTGNSGEALLLNPNAVSGPLDSKWLHPYGGLEYNFSKEWTGKVYWDYYGYHEDPTLGAVQDILVPRNFRGNVFTLSLRYAM